MAKQGRVTITDIAKAMGISHATVSMALRADSRIAAATRRKVEETARALGYQPSRLAQGLKSGRSGLIGIISDRSSWMLGERWEGDWLSGIHDAARAAGYRILLNLPPGGEDRARLSTPISAPGIADLADGMVDGVIVIGGGSLSKADLRLLEASGIPLVFAANDTPFPGHSQYLSGHGDRYQRIAGALLDRGHERIAVAGIAGANDFNRIALEAVRGAMAGRGLSFRETWFKALSTAPAPDTQKSWVRACRHWRDKAGVSAILLAYGDQGVALQAAAEKSGWAPEALPFLASLGPFNMPQRRWWRDGLLWDADAKAAGREVVGLLLERMQGAKARTLMLQWGPRPIAHYWEGVPEK